MMIYATEYISGCDCCNVSNCSGTNILRHIWNCSKNVNDIWYDCKLYETSSRNFAIINGITTSVDMTKGSNGACDAACRSVNFTYGRWSYII